MALDAAQITSLTVTPGFGQNFLKSVYTDPHARGMGLPYLAVSLIEYWAATVNDRTQAAKVVEGLDQAIHVHATGAAAFYWARPKLRDSYGAFYPTSPTGGVEGAATAVIAANGFQKFPSGIIMQWGSGTTDNTTGLATVTLPIPFPNKVFSITGVVKGVVQTSLISLRFDYVVATAISQFDVKALWVPPGPLNPAPTAADFYWEAKGY